MVAEVSTAESAAGLARAVVARTDRRTIKLESKRMVIATIKWVRAYALRE